MKLCSRFLINTVFCECHYSIYSQHLLEERKIERVNNCAWWPNWRKEAIEYFHTFHRYQKATGSTGKEFGLMINIQGPKSPWEEEHMDWVTALPQSVSKSYGSCLFKADRYSNTQIFLPHHEEETSMDKALLLWNRVISHTGLLRSIISDRDPKLTSALWSNLHRFFRTKSSFSTSYQPQTDQRSKRII
ncbi:hypothetical protein O181_012948 [Austropuccinia psidii MF-1]|uniref:Integrase catalytic domain-containing protein n=1 Tax=Austropuccinia psidii MF-1 TaxID=1389203 RepID=A0A9Q3BYA7_9BASI|nr:hypothetical protein [Austropuccinia psidii MF-1]